MVYKGTLLQILEYGDIFLTATSAENRKRLHILQNKGLHCALNKGLETSSMELYSEAKPRREQHLLNFMYDCAQDSSNDKEKPKTSIRTRSHKKVLLKIKRPHTEKSKKSL